MQRVVKQAGSFLLGGLMVAAVWLAGQRDSASVPVVYAQAPVTVSTAADANPQLLFQGQLLDPNTGQPVTDGAYSITFSLYNTASGGAPLWTETKQVGVTTGLFATLIGGVTPFNLDIFNGQTLYLGVRVGSDPEATPRHTIGYSAYAIRAERTYLSDLAVNADRLDGLDSTDFVRQGNNGIVAYGIVDADGSRIGGKRFSSNRSSNGIYNISIDNEDYNLNRFVTTVTVIDNDACPNAVIAKTGSNSGKLNVYLYDLSNHIVGCKFHFLTIEP
jgi:hypothetical protein